jgi:hypothetical protein
MTRINAISPPDSVPHSRLFAYIRGSSPSELNRGLRGFTQMSERRLEIAPALLHQGALAANRAIVSRLGMEKLAEVGNLPVGAGR